MSGPRLFNSQIPKKSLIMTKLYFLFNFKLTTIFAGYAIFSSIIWINTFVILPKQRVEVKVRVLRTESCRWTEPRCGPFIPGKDHFWRQRRIKTTFQRWDNSSEDWRRSLHPEGIMWRHTKIWEKLHFETPEVSFSVVTFASILSWFITSLYRDWPDGKFFFRGNIW